VDTFIERIWRPDVQTQAVFTLRGGIAPGRQVRIELGRLGPELKGIPHATFDAAGAGNGTMAAGLRATAKAAEQPPEPKVGAPVLDPTHNRHGLFCASCHVSNANLGAINRLQNDDGWLTCAAITPGAISNRSGVSGFRLDTRHLPGKVIMEGEKIAWSHHGGKIRGTDDRRTIARECNAAITNSCINRV